MVDFRKGFRPRSNHYRNMLVAIVFGCVTGYYTFDEPLRQYAIEQRAAKAASGAAFAATPASSSNTSETTGNNNNNNP